MGGTAPLETHEKGTGARKCAFLGHADMRNIFSKMSAALPKHIIGKSGVWGKNQLPAVLYRRFACRCC